MRIIRIIIVVALGGVILASTAPAPRAQSAFYKTTKGKSKPIYDEFVQEEFRVPTDYGRIYGVVKRPVVPEGVKVPVILTYTPYNISSRPTNSMNLNDDEAQYFVPRGYARAVFDLVGTRESGGCYDYGGIRERKTGAAVVDFLGSRGWSNGKVGMIGGSYEGTTAWAAAVESPPHLTTIVPQVAIGRWWDYAFGQGVRFFSGYGTPYIFDFGYGFLPPTNPTDPVGWAEAFRDHVMPCERIEHNDRAFLPDPVYDKFWDERDYLRRIDKVRASVLIEGSWRDYNVHPINSIEMWEALPEDWPKKLVMGRQGHNSAQLPDSQDIRHAWFDYWLLGLDTGVMDLPAVDSHINTNARFQEPSWPPPGTRDVIFRLGHASGDNSLALQDREEPVWTDNNPYLDENEAMNGDAGDAAIVFLGLPGDGDTRISGTPILKARIKTSGESTFLTPVIFDDGPGPGARYVITRGLLNSRNRTSLRKSLPLKPGQTWNARVQFQPIDWELLKGHRLGIALMSMNSYEALYPDDVRSTNEVLLDESRLIVPVAGS